MSNDVNEQYVRCGNLMSMGIGEADECGKKQALFTNQGCGSVTQPSSTIGMRGSSVSARRINWYSDSCCNLESPATPSHSSWAGSDPHKATRPAKLNH